jgi:GTP-binding protein Era
VRSGFVSVVGRPNVGKSTLVNALVGAKVAITSDRPQTTRNTIRGVVHRPDAQLILVDTPGLHRPRTELGERLNRLVYGSLADADAALFVVEAGGRIGPGDRLIAERLGSAGTTTVVAVNKIDAVDHRRVGEQLAAAGDWEFTAYVPISARNGTGLDVLVGELLALLPEGPAYFPPDATSDQPDRVVAGEIVREKYLGRLHEELPHSLTVGVDEMEARSDGTLYVAATVLVERESQKGMVIGKGGALVRAVGGEARAELETLFGVPVYLDLRVKVEKDWQRRPQILDRLGF